ncbi:MAG: sulfite exporter TauE/SafE family protein [Clostridia bacterium]|nr:sulfite exporter TauE/SafE family protein [Clostridia bacterium]
MKNKFKIIFWGCLAGLCNGLFGSGGGMVVVPCLENKFDVEPQKAHATAIAVILPLTLVSIIRYMSFSNVEPKLLFTACAGGALGSFAGAKLLKRFSSKVLKRIFGIFILAAAVRMVIA